MLAIYCMAVAKCTKWCFGTHPNGIEENDNNSVLSALFHTRWKESWNDLRLWMMFSYNSLLSYVFLMCSYRNVVYTLISIYIMTDFCILCSFQKFYAFSRQSVCILFCWRFLLIAIDMVIRMYEKSHGRFLFLFDLFN